MQNGDIVSGVVTGIKDYGAFVQVEDYCGLIHISEFSDGFVKNINDIVAIGDVVNVEILEIDEEGKKLKLSYLKVKTSCAFALLRITPKRWQR